MVQTDPDSSSVFLTYFDKLCELLLSFFMVLVEVTRIDPDLLYNFRTSNCNIRRKMHVRNKGSIYSHFSELSSDLSDGIYLSH